MRVRILLWLCLGILVGRLWSADPGRWSGRSVPVGVRILPELPCKSDLSPGLRLSILAPEDPEPILAPASAGLRRAILAVHGGNWIGGSKEAYGLQLARLAPHGYVIFAADYRLARPGRSSWPAVIEDLREAVRCIRRNAERYRVDPDHLAIMGSGAGGHLALMLGNDLATNPPADPEDSMKVLAVVSLYSPTDLEALVSDRHLANEPARTLLGGDSTTLLERSRAASPIRRVGPSSPPTMLIHGLEDLLVRPEQSISYARALQEARVVNRLLLIPSARHGFELQLGGPTAQDLLPAVLDFLTVACQTGLPNSTDLPTLSD